MNDKVVLGIHSTVDPDLQGSFNQFVDGHAWLSVTRNGRTEYYGLWPDDHPDVPDNGRGTDIRKGMEAGAGATASRYYELSTEQAAKLESELSKNVTWRYTNTCASWASETVASVTGRPMDANDTLGFETPRKLIETIREQERERPTSPINPLPPAPQKSRSFGAADFESLPSHTDPRTFFAEILNDPQRQLEWANQVEQQRQALGVGEPDGTSRQEPGTAAPSGLARA